MQLNGSSTCKRHLAAPGIVHKSSKMRRIAPFLVLVLAIFLCNFSFDAKHNQVEAKKLKALKLLKTVAKGYAWQSLSTKKKFLPLPVPIPGKWQQLLDLLDKQAQIHNRIHTGQGLSSLNSPQVGLMKDLLQLSKPIKQAGSASSTGVSKLDSLAILSSQLDLNGLKKYSRLAAARYATKLVSGKDSVVPNKHTGASSSNFDRASKIAQLIGNVAALGSSPSSAGLSAASGASGAAANLSQRKGLSGSSNDALVTLFNLVKLLQQLRQLDHAKLFNLAKKSDGLKDNLKQLPASVLTMNINNRKSFINKMNYIHKLTLDSNHRHRLNRAGNSAL